MNEDSREEHVSGSISTENTLKGIQLVSESSVDHNKCVICHKCDPANNIIGKVQGHQALKRAALIRDDNVTKRLKILE